MSAFTAIYMRNGARVDPLLMPQGFCKSLKLAGVAESKAHLVLLDGEETLGVLLWIGSIKCSAPNM